MPDVVTETLTSLEERLRRIELLLRGDGTASAADGQAEEEQTRPAAARLQKIEQRLADLCAHSTPAAEMLKLHSRLPELSGAHDSPAEDDVPTANKLPIVLASSTTISNAAAQLSAINDMPLPPSDHLATLASLQGRLDYVKAIQHQHIDQIDLLRNKTSYLLEQWYEDSILKHGDQWAELEQRLAKVEQAVRRQEATKAREQNEI